MRCLALILAAVVLTAPARHSSADDIPKRTAELQVLDRFIGTWDSVVTNKMTGDTGDTIEERRWSRKGTFVLSEDFNLRTQKEAHFLMTYDPNAKAYRTCYIDEFNTAPILGTWDEKTQTMTWNGTDAYKSRLTGTYRFVDKDTVEWSMIFTDPDGKVVIELATKQTRRKK
jgi:hypothetical protein